MRRALAALALLATLAATPATAQTGEARAVDVARSRAQFAIAHVFVEHVTGSVPILSGSVTLPPGSAIPLAAAATLDATRLATGDPDQTAALRGPDFFDTKTFPTWTFVSTKVTPHGTAAFGMDGTLTMHGVTQPEHLDVAVRGEPAHPVYHATGHIDRHAFGMRVTTLDPAIGGIADVTLDIVLR